MPILWMHGRVLPGAINISISDPPDINWHDNNLDIDVKINVQIQNSIVTVRFDLDLFRQEYFISLYYRAMDMARCIVDLIAFKKGYGLTVYIEEFVDEFGNKGPILLQDQRLADACTFSEEPGYAEVLLAVLSEPAVFMALNDLVTANTLPHVAAVNCARAVEGIKHAIAPTNCSDKQAWAALHGELNLTENYCRLVTNMSRDNRHGKRVHIPGPAAMENILRAWVIMNRFLEYRRRGNMALPLGEFPLLA